MSAAYRFFGADYAHHLDYNRLGSQLERIKNFMLDGTWRTASEIAHFTGLPESADLTKQLRHLRYIEHGQHRVNRRRRGDVSRGLYEYQVLAAGTGDAVPPRRGALARLEIAELSVELLTAALRSVDPMHPLLGELCQVKPTRNVRRSVTRRKAPTR